MDQFLAEEKSPSFDLLALFLKESDGRARLVPLEEAMARLKSIQAGSRPGTDS